ncbi:hypothetical protein A5747_13310 [Mycobacterium sp. IS-836]|nr:hypothetical protein A5747_13310 [Mycobacterium sp. IS-836]
MPSGEAGLDPNFAKDGSTNTGISNLPDKTQENVTSSYGTQVSNDPGVTSAAGLFGGLVSLVNAVTQGLADLINALFAGFTGVIGAIANGIVEVIGAIADFIAGIFHGFGQIQDGLYNSISGQSAVGVNWSDTARQVTDLKNTVVDLQSSIESMRFEQLPPGGANHADEFLTNTAAGWGAGWTTAGDGTSYISNGLVVWQDSGSVARTYGGYRADETKSDLQIVSMILNTTIEYTSFTPATVAGNQLRGRVGDNGSSYIYARLYTYQVEIGCVVNGTKHVWDTFPLPGNPPVGSLLELQCGTETDANAIEVFLNRVPIAGYTDTAAQAKKGAGYRKGGMDMFSDAGPFSSEATPAFIDRWAMRDLAPPGVVGSGMEVKRLGAGTVTALVGNHPVPGDYFDTVVYCTDDLTWDTHTSKITVSKDGMYMLKFSLFLGTPPPSNTALYSSVYVDNGTELLGGLYVIEGSPAFGSPTNVANVVGDFALALKAGDVVQPSIAIASSNNVNLTGDPLGQVAWMTFTKVG